MTRLLLSLLFSAQLFLTNVFPPSIPEPPSVVRLDPSRMMWGLIDPDLSAWFARLPAVSDEENAPRVLWDWSWHGFLASIFGNSFLKEVTDDEAQL